MTNTLALYWYTTVYSTSSYHYSIYQCVCVFFYICALFSGARGSFVALSAAGHEGDQPVHHGASLGPGRAPWRVLWAFKDAKSGKYHGAAFRGARAKQCNEKPTYELFCSTAVKAFSFVTATVQQQSYIKFVWTTTNVCGHLHMRVCCACAMIPHRCMPFYSPNGYFGPCREAGSRRSHDHESNVGPSLLRNRTES